mmetsp:Transcript_21082/g.37937  ORF Transcript_21082/g.37937 Transcript_21082/m.37937 type:complete len:238 (-) Transcript_21082:191-904(-)|eukprot:CAMPEP_0197641768 /NCGR_PEP_ID=MMETSP1338-20131121/15628_1 /TAXON_ID=43686 ORGANISM="Pelagodinium beii, Strain RCC1491" /NCGR_SAMPLE_ID=MMETSP1338 /ASSEMBLY_ACC=CAM_ASM_000754 /LENGTH=237 /DNA_ID=CAMNT_0043214799 /DNA_START=72 /DNA_END=785 /DNA_ORIENTATION=-
MPHNHKRASKNQASATEAAQALTNSDEDQLEKKIDDLLCKKMSDLHRTLDARISIVEGRLADLESKFTNFLHLRSYTSPIRRDDFDNVAARLDRMETLLFSIPDVAKLDSAMDNLMRTQAELEGKELTCQIAMPQVPSLPSGAAPAAGYVDEDQVSGKWKGEETYLFDGRWKDAENVEVSISGAAGTISGDDGGVLKITVLDQRSLRMEVDKKVFVGTVSGSGNLEWDDGLVRIRVS